MKSKPLNYGQIVQTYDIREDGIITNTKRKKSVVPHIDKDGYRNISLSTHKEDGTCYTKRYRLCVLVANIFVAEKPTPTSTVNHIDTDKLNDHYSNLEWLESVDNYKHACKHGLNPKGFKHGRANTNEDVLENVCLALIAGETQSSISKKYGIPASNVSKIKNKENWKEFSDSYFNLIDGKVVKI